MGLTAAALWGGSDFVGGVGARRASALLLVAAGHLVTLILLLLVCLGAGLPLPASRALVLGLLAGFEGALSLALFYRALASGAMGATAAVTGVLTAAVPVGFALATQGWPRATEVGGLCLGAAAIALTAWTEEPGRARLALGALAGVGFGVQLVLLKLAAEGGVVWAMTTARAGGLLGVTLALAVSAKAGIMPGTMTANRLPRSGFWRMGILAGVLDATGNGAYMLAVGMGRMEVGAMVASLYPAVTIVLAAVLLKEHLSRRQRSGVGLALAAMVLLSL
jgi:drug/metabolite transporter (DMT)-like permease